LGALVSIAASTAAADVTGILAASVLAAVGLLIIPARRRRARSEMREKMTILRAKLVDALRTEFQATRERSAQRLADALAPYSRFVRAEHGRWDQVRATLAGWRDRARQLLATVGSVE
jgi:ABC-type transport system involved in cytochrome bd biosynthesis fused ATPase/permease subunit